MMELDRFWGFSVIVLAFLLYHSQSNSQLCQFPQQRQVLLFHFRHCPHVTSSSAPSDLLSQL